MLAYRHTFTPPPPPRLVEAALPEPGPPAGAYVDRDTRNLGLTGWWVEPCWLCGTWLWVERRVNELGHLLPPLTNARGRFFEHCDANWKPTEALFVPYAGV